jgi:hypothetical protein
VFPAAPFGSLYFCDVMALDVWVQLLEQVACVFRPVVSQMLFVQEEVDAQVCFADYGGVLNRKIADAGEHKVLERLDTHDAGSGVDEEDVRILERDLTGSPPETKLAVVPASVS